MRVGLNATCFNDRPSGANQRFRRLYGALIRRNPAVEYVVYEPADQRIAGWFAGLPNVVARATPLPSVGRLARFRVGLSYWKRALRRDAPDIFETFSLPLVAAPGCPTLLTIHDLRPVHAGQPFAGRLLAVPVLRHALARADHVIAVSQTVEAELLAFHPGLAVSTIYNGVDSASFAAPDPAAIEEAGRRYRLPDRFALAVGHLEPRKNLPMLIDAIAQLRERGQGRPLVIVGRDGGQRAEILARIAGRRVGPLVTVIEDAGDDLVRALYALCALVVVPSRYEGFGIALIEAMAAARPLVTSDIPVFRELTQGMGHYFPPGDSSAAADAIDRVWSDAGERERLIAHGRRRVADFGFDRLADELAALHRSLAGSGTPRMPAMRARAASSE